MGRDDADSRFAKQRRRLLLAIPLLVQSPSPAAFAAAPSGSAADSFVQDVSAFGARCDGVSDDSAAFQEAAATAYAKGGTLVFRSPHCVVRRALQLTGTPGGNLRVTGAGSGHVTLSGNDFVVVRPTGMVRSVAMEFGDFTIDNTAPHPSGDFIVVDNSRVGRDGVHKVHFHDLWGTGYRRFISLIDSHDARGERIFGQSGSSTDLDVAGVYLFGESSSRQKWTLNSIWEHNTFVGGIGFDIIGAIQGVNLTMNKCVTCSYGVLNRRQDTQEGFAFSHNYWEGYYAGVKMTRAAFLQIDGDSADLDGKHVSPGWHAFWVGRDASSPDFPLGIEIHDTMVFGIGAASSPPFYVGATVGTISGNQVIGLAGHDGHCFDVQSAPNRNAMLVVEGNSCWAAGDFAADRRAVRMRHNLWSGSNNDRVLEQSDSVLPDNPQ